MGWCLAWALHLLKACDKLRLRRRTSLRHGMRPPVEHDAVLLRTALNALALASAEDARRPAIREAYEKLAIFNNGDR
ncbi:hypothetical protein GCM10022416_58980 [Actinomadura keratinilytica]|uniref:Uncharacterized protein n=1 Tax=Actinomadura keratinilytica TaxID=547461 RepID=A0ABP7ZH01_9ACTN